MERSDTFDGERWVRVRGIDGSCALGYNPHTFIGRIGVRLPDGSTALISKEDVIDASELARAWMAGYLAGNEPSPEYMFGPSIHEADESDSRWDRWRMANDELRRTGSWRYEPWRHLIPFPQGVQLPDRVWTLRGDEVWTWVGGQWRLAEPQPERKFRLLRGTVCFERGHCDLEVVTSAHSVCVDCGATDEIVPEGYSLEEWDAVRFGYVAQMLEEP